MSNTERVMVTGGAGFIGSHLVDRLMAGGNEVTVYDNFSSGRREFIRGHLRKKNFNLIEADLLDPGRLMEAVAGQDIVCHMAANPDIRAGISEPSVDFNQGIVATYNVLEALRLNGVGKIVFSSSSVVYGEPDLVPTPENYGPLKPISIYGAAKLASEGLITSYSHTFGIQCWLFRFANIIGKRATHGVLVDFKNKLKNSPGALEVLGDGNQEKSYLLVDECVDAILFAVGKSRGEVNIFNLGSSDNIRVSEIARIFLEECGSGDTRIVYTGGERGWRGDVPKMLLDVSAINRLGWRARCTSAEAVRRAAKAVLVS